MEQRGVLEAVAAPAAAHELLGHGIERRPPGAARGARRRCRTGRSGRGPRAAPPAPPPTVVRPRRRCGRGRRRRRTRSVGVLTRGWWQVPHPPGQAFGPSPAAVAGLHSAHHPQRSGRDAHGNRHGRTAAAAPRRTTWSATGSSSPGIGAGFEGTIGIRVLGPRGKVVGEDSAQSSGGGIGVGDFSARVRVTDPPRPGTRLTVQVFGDNPGLPDEGPIARVRPARGRGDLLPRLARLPALPGRVRRHADRHRPQAQGPSPRSPSSRSWPPTPGSRTPT